MQLVKQISIDTTLRQLIADPEVEPSKTLKGFLTLTGSDFTRLAAHIGVDRIVLSRVVNGRFKNKKLLRDYQKKVADGLGWPVELLWPENGSETDS